MGFNRNEQKVTLTASGGATPSASIQIPLADQPTQNNTIWLVSDGRTVTSVNWTVTLGGKTIASGTIAAGIAYDTIYYEPGILPPGNMNTSKTDTFAKQTGLKVNLTNTDAAAGVVLMVLSYSDRGYGL